MTKSLSMKAAVLENYGAPFRLTSIARPVPQSGQVLIRIMASGVNPLDLKIRSGDAAHARHPLPETPRAVPQSHPVGGKVTSIAARFSHTNNTRFPRATKSAMRLVIVCDFPVPGGP